MDTYTRQRYILNTNSDKAQNAIYNLLLTIPISLDDDIRTRLLYDDARTKLLEAFRACQAIYAITAPPEPPLGPCCGTHSV